MLTDQDIYIGLIKWTDYYDQKALLWEMLSYSERQKVNRFVLQRDQYQFLITRGLLRILIGKLIDCSPKELLLNYGQFGKPALLGQALKFNLSHAKNYVAYAFCKYEIGIDIEYQKHCLPIQGLAKRYFSDSENKVLDDLNYFDKQNAFFNGWVKKEAIVKAFGYGQNWPLATVAVDIKCKDVTRAAYQVIHSNYSRKVWLCSLQASPQFKGALAVITDRQSMTVQKLDAKLLGAL